MLRRQLEPYPQALGLARKLYGFAAQKSMAFREARLQGGDNRWTFPVGSSGPFGEETDGAWECLEQVAYQWLNYMIKFGYHHLDYDGDWFDFHATRLAAPPPVHRL
jgi:hypothetical protein